MFPDVEVIIIPFSKPSPYFISSCLGLIYFSSLCFFCGVSYILWYHETNALSWKWRSFVVTCVLVLLHYKIRCEDHQEEEASFTTKDFRTKIHLSYLINWQQLLKINPRGSTRAMHSSKEPTENWSQSCKESTSLAQGLEQPRHKLWASTHKSQFDSFDVVLLQCA